MNARSNPRRANGHRRDILRRRVLAAYDVCAICGRPVDKTLRSPHPMSAEVDELIPVSRGGDPLSFKDSLLSGGITRSKKNHGRRLTKLAAQAPPFKAGVSRPSLYVALVLHVLLHQAPPRAGFPAIRSRWGRTWPRPVRIAACVSGKNEKERSS